MKRFVILLASISQMILLTSSQGMAPSTVPTIGSRTRRIDTHCHFVPPWYRDLLISRNITSGGISIPHWNVTSHLQLNTMFGIETSVVSISTPGAKLSGDAPIDEGRFLARQLNEYAHNLTKEYPGKFLFFACLTLPDLEGAVTEAIYALDTLKAAGIILEASSFGEVLGTPRYEPLYKVLNDRNAIVFIHPSNSPCPEAPKETSRSTDLPPYVVDFLLDTTRAAANLVYRNVTRDYPNITFILAHSGGFLPFAATRAASSLALLWGDSSLTSALAGFYLAEAAKFNVDLALSANPTALPSTLAYFDTTRITFGSDFPYSPQVAVKQNVDGLANYGRLREGGKNRINYGNAKCLFKRFLLEGAGVHLSGKRTSTLSLGRAPNPNTMGRQSKN